MLDLLWNAYQQGQIGSATADAEFAKHDGERTAARLQSETMRLESKIVALALICQALWEIVREKTNLTEKDIEDKMREIDLRDGRRDARITGHPTECPRCHRPAHTRQKICMYCAAPITVGHLVEKPMPKGPSAADSRGAE